MIHQQGIEQAANDESNQEAARQVALVRSRQLGGEAPNAIKHIEHCQHAGGAQLDPDVQILIMWI